ncbi:MAG: hypothetical protein AB1390_08195 [Nitrospirota bacterium]
MKKGKLISLLNKDLADEHAAVLINLDLTIQQEAYEAEEMQDYIKK